jgi:integral membrane protein
MLDLFKTALGRFRIIAFTEGVSYLILLFIAMPLKYAWGQPTFVRYFGSIHGLLFVLYILYALLCKIEYRWTLKKTLILLGISIIPFGNFYADKHYLQSENQQ